MEAIHCKLSQHLGIQMAACPFILQNWAGWCSLGMPCLSVAVGALIFRKGVHGESMIVEGC